METEVALERTHVGGELDHDEEEGGHAECVE